MRAGGSSILGYRGWGTRLQRSAGVWGSELDVLGLSVLEVPS